MQTYPSRRVDVHTLLRQKKLDHILSREHGGDVERIVVVLKPISNVHQQK